MRHAVLALVALAACTSATVPAERNTTPGQNPLAAEQGSSRSSGPSVSGDTGTVSVAVTRADGSPAARVRVELGGWDGVPQAFRDSTIAGVMVPSTADTRFHVLATTLTDKMGNVSFTAVEKKQTFAVRAMPADAPGAYFPSLFWLYTSPTMSLSIHLPR